jgi:hypothetical protein
MFTSKKTTRALGMAAAATLVGGSVFHASETFAVTSPATSHPGAPTISQQAGSVQHLISSSSQVLPQMAACTALAGLGVAAMRRRNVPMKKLQVSPEVVLHAFEAELGVQAPVGFWDPAGLAKDGDVVAYKRRRATEIKHGRVSMIACLGYIVPEYFKWPGYVAPKEGIAFADIPNGLAALSKVPGAGIAQMIAFVAAMETQFLKVDDNRAPGDYANCGVLGLPYADGEKDEAKRTKRLNAEIANGRLAMVAIIGMFYQDGLTGSAWGDWASYTDSPLRAFESELGVQEPVGFWDPLGLSADGDAATFKRRRAAEIKHGRICMYATIGYMVPEYYKFPGYLSPSASLKFEDVPNGLGALSKLPLLGGAQIIAFCGIIETTGFFSGSATAGRGPRGNGTMKDSTESGTPGDYGIGFPNFIGKVADPAEKKTKLAAELANGRLAMVAIIGMFFQDGLTGAAWGDWSLYTASPLR